MKNNNIILVAGEPNSIFLEIFFKALKTNKFKSPLILICCKKQLEKELKKFKFRKEINLLRLNNIQKSKVNNKKINLIDIEYKKSSNKKLNFKLKNKFIEKSFEVAFKLINDGYSYKLINGPINKKSFLNKKFLGITEYVSSKFKSPKIGMLIYNKKLSVSPITTHLPLKLVSKKITKKIIQEKIIIINTFYKKFLHFKPKIAVTGLNPHCESVLKLNEDEKHVSEAIKYLKKKKIQVKGPFPADTIFLKKNRKKFNIIVGMYHDQVLTPLKTLYEFNAINITMGLPFLRVSPDHGPNQEMLGQNQSNPLSLIESIKFLDTK